MVPDAVIALDEDEATAGSIVCVIPVTNLPRLHALPFLLTGSEIAGVKIAIEVLAWARASCLSLDLSTIERQVKTIQKFYEFCHVFTRDLTLEEDLLDYLIYAYLLWRLNGTIGNDGRSLIPTICWKRQSADILMQEFRALARYFNFCSKQFGYVGLDGKRYRQSRDSPGYRRLEDRDTSDRDDFLVHLGASREFWARRLGASTPLLPPVTRMKYQRTGHGTRTIMAEEEIWAVIQAETNPVFRAIWLMAAFGGPRISEQLNFWQCDVLPASYHLPLLGYEYNATPLVLKADPERSRYVGDISKKGITRSQYFGEHYNDRYRPRNNYSKQEPLRAGWKSMLYMNDDLKFSPVFWISIEAANLFDECADALRQFHHRHNTSKVHPWFYVNVADPTGAYRALPTKMSNVQGAWNRACRRCGLEPHRWGRHLHALRHYYKHYALETLSISERHLQLMLGHTRLESQYDYGRISRDVHDQLKTSLHFKDTDPMTWHL